ncbi:hypothetical protein H9Y04_17825 [Streptomyces sp. TRM66268-LWL]|uniref:Spore protein YkvP/CgeB glycosyl transferase-like domain-containing protein n=1 Tax=Streptomyces polyasparticus TaxID=2767826 RepID=A0ABR7SG05_9ACTN|nr:hypothetical protein [Streptomyces polyasparticus]MBC9714421.1 hypothetical protein [Streptomyces polyasparticus]
MAEPPLVLQISNDVRDDGADNSFVRAFAALAAEGLVRHRYLAPAVTLLDLAGVAAMERPDLVLVQSPQSRAWTRPQVDEVLRLLGDPPLVVWEGDAWGGWLKRPRESNLHWMRRAAAVFSAAGGEQLDLLHRATGAPAYYAPNVAPLRFAADTADPGPAGREVAFLGTRRTFLGVELLPDDRGRLALVRLLDRMDGCDLAVYGRSWRGRYARGPVPYGEQLTAMRRALVTAGWNRYRRYDGYASDRLPIALCAGRVHVTSREADLDWLPGPEDGLHRLDTPREAADRVRELLTADPRELLAQAARARSWAVRHLTETQFLRHLLAPFLPVAAPRGGPWPHLSQPTPLRLAGAGQPEHV